MKFIFLLIGFFLSMAVKSQDIISRMVSKSICDCIPEIVEASELVDNTAECFTRAIGKDSTLLLQELTKKYGKQAEEKFYELGYKYYTENSINLVYTCDAYFHYFDTIRLQPIKALNKDSLRKALAGFQSTDKSFRDSLYFFNRGLCSLFLSDYGGALADFKLGKDSYSNIMRLNFMAFANEMSGKYEEAIKLYDQLALLTKKNEFKIFSALAIRKKGQL